MGLEEFEICANKQGQLFITEKDKEYIDRSTGRMVEESEIECVRRVLNKRLWKQPEQLDEFDKPVVYWTSNGKVGTFKELICRICTSGGGQRIASRQEHMRSWMGKCKKYSIVKWCYASEIAPVE